MRFTVKVFYNMFAGPSDIFSAWKLWLVVENAKLALEPREIVVTNPRN